jgi:hypothetical protein
MSTHHDVDDEHLKYDLSKEERNAFDMYMAACLGNQQNYGEGNVDTAFKCAITMQMRRFSTVALAAVIERRKCLGIVPEHIPSGSGISEG